MSARADEAFARYVERLVVGGERLSVEELAAGDEELRASLLPRLEAFHSIDEALGRRPQPVVGTTLGSYRVLAALGSGGMGEVYRARDERLGREVALKLLPPLFAFDPQRRARFEREARLLAAVDHPNVEAIYGIERLEGRACLVLELVAGESLADRLERGPLPVAQALALLGDVAAGLEAAHARGIIHRDLKPANVQITPEGRAKVLDFGLGKECGAEGPAALPTLTRRAPTITGMVLGTASYMSPEQARGLGLDERTDVWSFGCVLYEALSARRAFPGETFADAVARVFHREPDWGALPPETPWAIRRLLRRCLEKDRRSRLETIRAARSTLERSRKPLQAWHRQSLSLALSAATIILALASFGPPPRKDRTLSHAATVPAPTSRPSAPSAAAVLAPAVHLDPRAYRSSLVAAYTRWREAYDRGFGGSAPADSSLAYAATSEPAAVDVISTSSQRVVATVPLPVRDRGDLVWTIGLTPDATRIYATAAGETDRVFVIDTRSHTLLTVPDGEGIRVEDEPAFLVLTPNGRRAYVSHLSGHVAVIDTDPESPTYHRRLAVPDGPTLKLPGKLSGIAVSPDGQRLYVSSERPDTLTVFDTDPRSPTYHRRLHVPDGPAIPIGRGRRRLLSFSHEGNRLYAANNLSDDVTIVDTQPGSPTYHRVLATVAAPGYPTAVGVTPDGSLAYVTLAIATTVATLDTSSASMVLEPIEVGASAAWIAFSPDGTRGFVPNMASMTVSVIDTDPRSSSFRTVVATVPTRGRPGCVVVGPTTSQAGRR